jgi:hypothetical protein
MPLYLVERTFPDGLRIPLTAEGTDQCHTIVSTTPMTW